MIAPNQTGTSPHGFADYGNSMIVDPWGTVVARAGDGEAGDHGRDRRRSASRACGARCRASATHACSHDTPRRRERRPRSAHRRSEPVPARHVRRRRSPRCARFRPLGAERIAVADAAGRVLARDVRTTLDLPHFARSYMDGYAVRAARHRGRDRGAPVRLRDRRQHRDGPAGAQAPRRRRRRCASRPAACCPRAPTRS